MNDIPFYGHWNAAREDRRIPPHRNQGLELVYVENGRVSWEYEGKVVEAGPGMVTYSWPWETHAARGGRLPSVEIHWIVLPIVCVQGKPGLRGAYALDIDPLRASTACTRLLAELQYRKERGVTLLGDFRSNFKKLLQSLSCSEGYWNLAALGNLCLCLEDVRRAVSGEEATGQESLDLRLRKFWEEEIPPCLDEYWPLERMASQCGMGRTLFGQGVKRLYGETPIQLLTRKRVEFAAKRLCESGDSITEIALEAGFDSSQRFATVFRGIRGQTPSAYRRGAPG